MWLVFILGLVIGCQKEKLLECLMMGRKNTECVSSEGCVEKKIEQLVLELGLRITGYVIHPDYYQEMFDFRCSLQKIEICFLSKSIETLDCIAREFCIEYVDIEGLGEINELENKGIEEMGYQKPFRQDEGLDHNYKEQAKQQIADLYVVVEEKLNGRDDEVLLVKFGKIEERLEEIENEITYKEVEGKVIRATEKVSSKIEDKNLKGIDMQYKEEPITKEPESLTDHLSQNDFLQRSEQPSDCTNDCKALCAKNPSTPTCISLCHSNLCPSASSDFFLVYLTGFILFLIVGVLYSFLQTKSLRI